MRNLVQAFKYRGARELLAPLGRRLGASPLLDGLVAPARGVLVVAVPARRTSRRRRGYDQARDLAAALAGERAWPLASPRALVRRRDPTSPQAGRTRAARLRGPRATFQAEPALVAGHHVLLVDDVLSTGATADAATRALRLAGARTIAVTTLAT